MSGHGNGGKGDKPPKRNGEKRNYDVGYGKPPKGWKKDESGNPGGRPPLWETAERLTRGKITVRTEDGPRERDFWRVVAENLVNAAIRGEVSAQRKIIKMSEHLQALRTQADLQQCTGVLRLVGGYLTKEEWTAKYGTPDDESEKDED